MIYAQSIDLATGSGLVAFLLGGGLIGFLTALWQLVRQIRAGRTSDEESMLRRYRRRVRLANAELVWTQGQIGHWMRWAAKLEHELRSTTGADIERPAQLQETFDGPDEDDLEEDLEDEVPRRRRIR